MPIDLNKTLTEQNVNIYNAKFFNPLLTGKGQDIGVLSRFLNPRENSVSTSLKWQPIAKDKEINGNQTTHTIHISPMSLSTIISNEYAKININKMKLIGKTANQNMPIHLLITPAIVLIRYTTEDSKTVSKEINVIYDLTIVKTADPNSDLYYHVRPSVPMASKLTSAPRNEYYATRVNSQQINQLDATELHRIIHTTSYSLNLDSNAITEYVDDYNLYYEVIKMSEIWQESMDRVFENTLLSAPQKDLAIGNIIEQVKYILKYNIPLETYKRIYAALTQHISQKSDIDQICRHNLNLLLINTLTDLKSHKSSIPMFTPNDTNLPESVRKLSISQATAVKSQEPLIMVQAGAGTGKSTLILGRIDYLIHSGVKPEDITVLSFTNAAANHIKEKNSHITSSTIASMIHEIYGANYSNHKLSTIDTIINAIDIYFPQSQQDSVEYRFKSKLTRLWANDNDAFVNLNNFIEDNYDEIIKILDTIGQTSLELESIICYQQIDNFIEPATIKSKYLIIDEVQDNSVFEFIYVLKYIAKHKESLFIVGDCSQTLYEFRASNPRALNVLESSGVFTCYQLKVNYRSTQEILDFANIILDDIDANRYAKIQLMSANMNTPTEQEFLDTVNFNYYRLQSGGRKNSLEIAIPHIFRNEVKVYIDKCLAKNEKVTFLAHKRKDIEYMQNTLKALYPDRTSVSLIPKRVYNSTILSMYVKKRWNTVTFFDIDKLSVSLYRDIVESIPTINVDIKDKQSPKYLAIKSFIDEWYNSQKRIIDSWVAQTKNNILTTKALFELIKESIIQYEINTNAVKQRIVSSADRIDQNSPEYQQASFVLSTIHSAKGLEFDNVVVLYKDDNNMAEDKKRMYYVALTRAMKTECIIAYGTLASPRVQADYISVCSQLHDRAPAINSPVKRKAQELKHAFFI